MLLSTQGIKIKIILHFYGVDNMMNNNGNFISHIVWQLVLPFSDTFEN